MLKLFLTGGSCSLPGLRKEFQRVTVNILLTKHALTQEVAYNSLLIGR